MDIIKVEGLTKYYRPRNVVDDLTFHVNKGEVFGFLGRNGAGKSTVINMLTGIIHPTEGEFTLFGQRISEQAVKRNIGVLPDYNSFYGALTAVDHLKYYARVSGQPISTEQCHETLKKVGLEVDRKRKVGKFSFGMKKKLGIAQAIVTDPDLIFLDEPTSGLDAEAVVTIQHLIRELNAAGKTIFMTSHNLDEVEKLCSRIAIMKQAKLLSLGTMSELRKQYQSFMTVRIKHSFFQADKGSAIRKYIESLGTNIKWETNTLSIDVHEEDNIPRMLRTLIRENIDIFRMEVVEPSLEDIFLDQK